MLPLYPHRSVKEQQISGLTAKGRVPKGNQQCLLRVSTYILGLFKCSCLYDSVQISSIPRFSKQILCI